MRVRVIGFICGYFEVVRSVVMKDRFCSALVGVAVGDALGGPLRFMSANQIQIKHGEVSSFLSGGLVNLRAGQYTGNTALMMITAESFIENGDIAPDDLMKGYLKWYHSNPQNIGQITRGVLALMEMGTSLNEAARQYDENGAGRVEDCDFLLRCVPYALSYFDDMEKMMSQTFAAAKLTHYDRKMASGAVVLNLIVGRILNGETDKKKIMDQVQLLLDENEVGVYNVLPEFCHKKKHEMRTGSRMQDVLETALWCWYKTRDFRSALVTAVNLGGDTSTIAAVTGAIAGVYYGLDGIPREWLVGVEDKNILSGMGKRIYRMVSEKGADEEK